MGITIIRYSAIILSGLVALLALSIGGYPTMLKMFSYIPFSPAKFYFKAMKAINKLEALEGKVESKSGEEYKCGTVKQGETGFSELVEILREKAMLGEEIKEVKLVEESAAITPNSTAWKTNANADPRNPILVLYDLPGASTDPWTSSNLDSAQIGYRCSTTNTNNAQISTVWLAFDYTEAEAGGAEPTARSLNLLGVGI